MKPGKRAPFHISGEWGSFYCSVAIPEVFIFNKRVQTTAFRRSHQRHPLLLFFLFFFGLAHLGRYHRRAVEIVNAGKDYAVIAHRSRIVPLAALLGL